MTFTRATVLAVSLLLVGGTTSAREDEVDHARFEHRFVRITSARLHPDPLRMTPDEAIGWVNYSSKITRVSFEKGIAAKLACRSQASFRFTGDRLESNDIQGGQFASLCRLAPGRYAYQVTLFDGAGAGGSPPSTLREGTIVVE